MYGLENFASIAVYSLTGKRYEIGPMRRDTALRYVLRLLLVLNQNKTSQKIPELRWQTETVKFNNDHALIILQFVYI